MDVAMVRAPASLILLLTGLVGVNGYSNKDVIRLQNDLFANYSKHLRPAVNQSQPTVINVDIYLMYIHRLDEKEQELSFSAWLYMAWYDKFLRWDEEKYNGVPTMLVSPSMIWKPDIAVSNSYERMTKYASGDYLIRVDSDGLVDWSPGDVFRTHCTVDITFYPFDIQTCNITLGSWMYDVSEMDINAIGNISLTDYKVSGEWDVLSTRAIRDEEAFECCPGESTVAVHFSLTIARRKSFYILTVIIPVLLFSFLNVVDFVLPPASGEKMALSVTVFLSFAFFMSILNESMPRTSLSFSILGIYMIIVMGMGTLSVLLSAVVIVIYHRAREQTPQTGRVSSFAQRQSVCIRKTPTNPPDFLPAQADCVVKTLEGTLYYDDDFDSQSVGDGDSRQETTIDKAGKQSDSPETSLFLMARRCDRLFLWSSLGLTISGAVIVMVLLTYH